MPYFCRLSAMRSAMRSAIRAVFMAALLGCTACAHAADASAAPAPSTAPGAAEIAPADAAWLAALPQDPEAATQAYLARLSPEARTRSDAYFEGGYWLLLIDFLYSLGIAAILLRRGLFASLSARMARISRFGVVQTAAIGAAYTTLSWLLGSPLAIYEGFFRERAYGLMNQNFAAWCGEQLIQFIIMLITGTVGIVIVYAALRRAGRNWWVWASGFGVVLIAFQILITPVFLAPLFNHYEPLLAGPVRDSILSLARANGIPAERVYFFDASRQTKRISANVSGILGTTTISLNDNLLKRTSLPEIRAVMAHEMGHYVLNHIFSALVFIGLILAAGLAFVNWGFAVLAERARAWRIQSISDIAGLPLLVALFSVFSLVLTPVQNSLVRMQETQADIFGLNAAREPEGFAEVALKASEYRKLNPGPLEEMFFFDHPSGHSRILMAMRWKAENPRK